MADRTRTQAEPNRQQHRVSSEAGEFNPRSHHGLDSGRLVHFPVWQTIWIICLMGYHSEIGSARRIHRGGAGENACLPSPAKTRADEDVSLVEIRSIRRPRRSTAARAREREAMAEGMYHVAIAMVKGLAHIRGQRRVGRIFNRRLSGSRIMINLNDRATVGVAVNLVVGVLHGTTWGHTFHSRAGDTISRNWAAGELARDFVKDHTQSMRFHRPFVLAPAKACVWPTDRFEQSAGFARQRPKMQSSEPDIGAPLPSSTEYQSLPCTILYRDQTATILSSGRPSQIADTQEDRDEPQANTRRVGKHPRELPAGSDAGRGSGFAANQGLHIVSARL